MILQANGQSKQPAPCVAGKGRGAYRRYNPEVLADALRQLAAGTATVAELGRLTGIPLRTIRRRAAEPETGAAGRPCVLTEQEEARIVRHLLVMSRIGLGYSTEDLRAAVSAITADRPNPFRDGVPGKRWLRSFFKRHPEISLRSTQSLSIVRASSDNKAKLTRYADLLEGLFRRHTLIARNIYNCDETMFKANTPRTIAPCGARTVVGIAPDAMQHTSVLACVNADGSAPVPPLVIMTGKTVMEDWICPDEIEGTTYTATDNGWSTREVFESWFLTFVRHAVAHRGVDSQGIPLPVLLVFDGHDSHISVKVTEAAEEAGILLLQLPAHTSHRLQPLDLGCFSSWHKALNKIVHARVKQNARSPIKRSDIGGLIAPAYRKALSPENVLGAFKGSGIFPFDRAKIIGDSTLSPAVAVSRLTPSPQVIQELASLLSPPTEAASASGVTTPCPRRSSKRLSDQTRDLSLSDLASLVRDNRQLRSDLRRETALRHKAETELDAFRQRTLDQTLRVPLSEQDPQAEPPRKKSRFATHGVNGEAVLLTTADLNQRIAHVDAARAAKKTARTRKGRVPNVLSDGSPPSQVRLCLVD